MMMSGGAFSGRSSSRDVDGETFGRVYDKRVIMRLMPYVRPYRLFAVLAFLSMLVYVGSQVAIPFLLGRGIDGYIKQGDFRGLLVMGGVFIAVALGEWRRTSFSSCSWPRLVWGCCTTCGARCSGTCRSYHFRTTTRRKWDALCRGYRGCVAAARAHDRGHYDGGRPAEPGRDRSDAAHS